MKRHPALRDLSDDHHGGLVLARRALRAGAGVGDDSSEVVWNRVEVQFDAILEPHFAIEETYLVPALEALGETYLIERLRREHAELRGLVAPESGRTAADLRRFGELLRAHIRFEEREVFQVAQEKLERSQLEAVRKACGSRSEPIAPPNPPARPGA